MLLPILWSSLAQIQAHERPAELLEAVESKVSTGMNETLMVEFATNKIKAAQDSIGDVNAPSLGLHLCTSL